MDDRLISKLYEVDPEFAPFMDTLYGVSKSGGGAAATGDPEKDKRNAKTALAATGVATAGGLHALKATHVEAKERSARAATGELPKGVSKIPGLRRLDSKKAAALATAGWVGLHGVELAADGMNTHTQTKRIREANEKIHKGLPGHFQPIGLVRANARANQMGQRLRGATFRRPRGAVTPIRKSAAPGVLTPIEKKLLGGVQDSLKLVQGVHSAQHAETLAGWGQKAATSERAQQHAETMAQFGRRRPQPGPTKGGRHRPTPPPPGPGAPPKGGRHASKEKSPVLGGRLKPVLAITGGTLAVGGAGAAGATVAERKRVPQSAPGTAVAKSADCEWQGEISKVDVEKRQVFGWASLSTVDGEPVTDRQGDYIAIEDSEEAAYRYMLSSRKGGDMHARIGKADGGPKHTADVIESIVFTPEKIEALGLEPDAVPLGWWIGMQIHDEQQWQDVKDGKRTGFSVHGTGMRKDMVLA